MLLAVFFVCGVSLGRSLASSFSNLNSTDEDDQYYSSLYGFYTYYYPSTRSEVSSRNTGSPYLSGIRDELDNDTSSLPWKDTYQEVDFGDVEDEWDNGNMGSYYDYNVPDDQQYLNCTGNVAWIGDGYCDRFQNTPQCGYDGGDCCSCTCRAATWYSCGVTGFDCRDRNATLLENLCDSPLGDDEILPCSPDLRRVWEVRDSDDVNALAKAINCSGGSFVANWKGNVIVEESIDVVQGTTLTVYGKTSSAIANGGGSSRVFTVIDASLNVSDLNFFDCFANVGGAVAASNSTLTFIRVGFHQNVAALYGGALFARNSSDLRLEQTAFADNSAGRSGGALFLSDTSFVSWSAETSFSANTADHSGGAMHVKGSTRLSGNGSSNFVANRARYGGALSLWEVGEAYLAGETTFLENVADLGIAGAIFIGGASNVTLGGVVNFKANVAGSGGGAIALYRAESNLRRPYVSMSGSVDFINNSCGGNGGAMVVLDALKMDIEEANLNFIGNAANISGGAVYVVDAQFSPTFRNAIFIENSARQNGGGVYSSKSAYTITKTLLSSNPTIFIGCLFESNEAGRAGGAIYSPSGVDVVYLSMFARNNAGVGGALRLGSQNAWVERCYFEENSANEGRGSAIAQEGVSLTVSSCTFQDNYFTCPSGEFVDSNRTDEASDERIYFDVCANCPECKTCNIEDKWLSICTPVMPHTTSSGGSVDLRALKVDKGYWRVTGDSRKILPCYNPEACLGGVTDSTSYCAGKYTGPYCAVCRTGYASRIPYKCESCAQKDGGALIIALVVAVAVLFGMGLVWHLLSQNHAVTDNGIISRVVRCLPLQSLKIVVVAWQIVTQFASAANVTFPNTYERFLNAVKFINFELEFVLSAACELDLNFHYRFLMITTGPFVILALLGVTYVIAVFQNRDSPDVLRRVRDKHTSVLLWLTILVYSSASSAVFRMFACDELEDDNGYHAKLLRTDYRIDCESKVHQQLRVYAGFMTAVYPAGIPVFYAILLYRQRKMLQDSFRREENSRLRSISALWNPYSPQRYYYEVIECFRRMLLAGAVAFIFPNTAAQVAITLAIALIFAFVCEGLAPYSSRRDAWMSRTGHAIVFFSMYMALLMKVDVSHEREASQEVFAYVLVAAHGGMVMAISIEAMAMTFWARVQEDEQPRIRSVRHDVDESEGVVTHPIGFLTRRGWKLADALSTMGWKSDFKTGSRIAPQVDSNMGSNMDSKMDSSMVVSVSREV